MSLPISRRQFIGLSVTGALGAGGYGLVRAVQKVRDAARSTSDL
ncbi:twin-arginine translocation signal domain-containing protein [Gemmata sp. G18]|uniref:Twin-arginine translocation signal domain-containing protein n=1 Tax=Gemmata palustris TaxID=2822762 RepID=A0ABS5BS62_9BACT|nr:twin-arginine translocation signal domain-containing protein [Gemmata palustris]MBP3956574.1 twin-arginine translocation signal domain-containing protein [Gemmata palustris]